MKIHAISTQYSINFTGNIIDSHMHRGTGTSRWDCQPFPDNRTDEYIKQPLNVDINGEKQVDNIKKVLVSSIDGLAWSEKQQNEVKGAGKDKLSLKPEELLFEKDEINANMDMINLHKKDAVYEVMAVCQPSKTGGKADNIRKLLNENEGIIRGLKFHPQDLMLNADSELYDDYMKLASEKKLPALFHSQVSIDYDKNQPKEVLNWSDPEYIYKLAKRHPDVPVILGHTGSGGSIAHNKAIDILMKSIDNKDANLYAEISWMDFADGAESKNPQSIISLIKKAKEKNSLHRIIFGTDAPLGCYGEKLLTNEQGQTISAKESYETTISRIKTAIKQNFKEESDGIINKIFYDNADELFFKKDWAKIIPKLLKETESETPDTKIQQAQKQVEQGVKKLSKTKIAAYIIGASAVAASIVYACKNKSLFNINKSASSK